MTAIEHHQQSLRSQLAHSFGKVGGPQRTRPDLVLSDIVGEQVEVRRGSRLVAPSVPCVVDNRRSAATGSGLDPLKQALGGYLAIPGIRAALLISDQGLLVSSMAKEGVDTASIAALAIDTVRTAQRFGQQVGAGTLDTMSVEFSGLTVVLAPFTPDVMLALLAAPGSVGILLGTLSDGKVGA